MDRQARYTRSHQEATPHWSTLVVDPTLKFPVDLGIDLIGLFSLKSIVDFEFGAK